MKSNTKLENTSDKSGIREQFAHNKSNFFRNEYFATSTPETPGA